MNSEHADVFARREPWRNDIELQFLFDRAPNGNAVVPEWRLRTLEEAADFPPGLRLAPHVAQKLMDELWNCGIRPSEGSGSAGTLAATQTHLKDMQKFAFELLAAVIPPRIYIDQSPGLRPIDAR